MSDLLEKNRNLDLTQQAKIDLHLEFSALLKEFQISDAVKSKLLTDAFSKHNLYISLPFELSKLCPEEKIDEQKLIKLSFYSYLYFSSILCFDKYYDNQINIVDNKDLIRTFMFFVKEQALRGLFTIINQSSDFWKEFDDLKILFFKSSNIGNTIDYKNFNDNVFLELAKNKSILSYAYVYSLKYMFGQIENEKILLNGLDKFHIGYQIYDDYKDLKEDKVNNQLNYFYFKIKQNASKDYENKPFEYLLKLSYIDNTITESLQLALIYLMESQKIFSEIEQQSLLNVASDTIYLIESELHFIKAAIRKANDKSTRSNVFVLENSIQKATDSALNYLQSNLNSDSLWEDFLTNAGYGKEWITGYVLCMIAEIDHTIYFLDNPLRLLLASQGGYNNHIVQDGDSSNFLIKASNIFKIPISENRINSWLEFSKPNGGWSTYYNNGIKISMRFPLDADFKGWFSPQLCVSTVAAWVAKDFKDSEIETVFEKTIEYIISNQNNDGSWNSYWWTENIYATAFALLSIPKQEESIRIIKKAVSYILMKQNKNGSWNNGKIESCFYTALALKSLIDFNAHYKDDQIQPFIDAGIDWLLRNQMSDGSWEVSRILQIPFPDILNPEEINDWRNTSFGLNCLVDDHNRIFTTSTVYNCLSLYGKQIR